MEVRFEEVDERAFLFRIEHRPDKERTTVIEDDRILDVLGELESAGCSLGQLRDILVLGLRLGAEPLGCDRTAQNSSVLSPKPVHVAIKQ
jgi:hypothetical protein